MENCRQICPYNTLTGCWVKELGKTCPLTNTAAPITEYRVTNADRIRAMSDEELAKALLTAFSCDDCKFGKEPPKCDDLCRENCVEWLKQPAEVLNDG